MASENHHDARIRSARLALAHEEPLEAIAEVAILLADYAETIAGALEALAHPKYIVGPADGADQTTSPVCACGNFDRPPEQHGSACPVYLAAKYRGHANLHPDLLRSERLTAGGYAIDFAGYAPGRFELARAADGMVWLHDHQDRKRYPLDPERSEEI